MVCHSVSLVDGVQRVLVQTFYRTGHTSQLSNSRQHMDHPALIRVRGREEGQAETERVPERERERERKRRRKMAFEILTTEGWIDIRHIFY